MRNPEQVLNNLIVHSKVSDYKFERLYRNLFNEKMFYIAYQRIYAKPGNMTPGAYGKTIDQMSTQRIERLIENLKNETYQPVPARRTYIPKKNGKLRPLGIPSFEDKLVQEVTRMLLEAIYEGHFECTSHGFRPFKSCHTAMDDIQKHFTGAKWFIEGDIKGFFDNIDHNVLIDILKQRISDERFLRLIRKFLNAGYMEKWTYHKTYSGTPQGGIVSPILANIYLDQFDKYIKEYAENFNTGKDRRVNPEYNRFCNKRNALKRKLKSEMDESVRQQLMDEIQALKAKMVTIPYNMAMDENYKRMKYVRYADDFLIGVIGSKEDCKKMKEDITIYMRDKLKLELSDEKTLITHSHEHAKFLGFEISVQKSDTLRRNSLGFTRRSFQGKVVISLSPDNVEKKLLALKAIRIKDIQGRRLWWPESRGYLVGKKEEELLMQYNLEIRGFYNYFSIANNIAAVGSGFGYAMRFSLYKTLANKHNSTISKVIKKYRKDKDFVIPYKDKNGKEKCVVLYNQGFKRQTINDFPDVDNLPNTCWLPEPTLVDRLKTSCCELCGQTGNVVMHHVRKLTLLKGENEWEKLMLKKRRKTLVVCETCNAKIQKASEK